MSLTELNLQLVEESGEYEDFDDAEEILSLCDLPLNSSSVPSDWDHDFSREKQDSSFDEDFFEFFSEDFTASTYSNSADNIIFCGKVISSKGEAEVEKVQSLRITSTTATRKHTRKNRSFLSNSFSFTKCTTSFSKREEETIPTESLEKYADKFDFSVKKASTLTTPMKPRWPLLALGMGRFPVVMEMRDIKMRQSKQSPRRMFHTEKGRDMMQRSARGSGRSFWGLRRFLGCKSYQTTAVVKASFDCIPSM